MGGFRVAGYGDRRARSRADHRGSGQSAWGNGKAALHPGPHRERQGRPVHGKPAAVALPVAQCRRTRARGRRSRRSAAGPAREGNVRTSFIETLSEIAAHDPRVTLVVGDLGFGVVTDFASRYPQQFLNAGVAEQNMTGVAAGMALAGRIVFTYSIANFPTLRCIEQIRNDICYHQANVKIVAVGGGYAYGSLGMTHHATEDLAILRSLPGLKVVAPGDPVEAEAATRAVMAHAGPCYLRLGRAGEAKIHPARIDFVLGKAIEVRQGRDITLISTGGMLGTATQVADILNSASVQTRILSMHTVKPIDTSAIESAVRETGAVFTLEEHSVLGGLGGAVAEFLAENWETALTFKRFGLPSEFSSFVGSQEYIRHRHGLSPEAIALAICAKLEKVQALAS